VVSPTWAASRMSWIVTMRPPQPFSTCLAILESYLMSLLLAVFQIGWIFLAILTRVRPARVALKARFCRGSVKEPWWMKVISPPSWPVPESYDASQSNTQPPWLVAGQDPSVRPARPRQAGDGGPRGRVRPCLGIPEGPQRTIQVWVVRGNGPCGTGPAGCRI